jgi:type IV pilus assembly protein PilB
MRGIPRALAAETFAEISRPKGSVSYDARVAKRIGELLVDGGVLSQSQLEQALFAQRKDGRKLGQLLIELGLVSEVQLTQTLSRQLSVPWVSLFHVDFSRSLLNTVPREVAERYCLIPIFVRRVRKQETLYVAMDDPTNEAAIEEVQRGATLPVKPMIACPSDIRAAIRVYYFGEAAPAPPPPSSVATPPSAPSPPASTTQAGAKAAAAPSVAAAAPPSGGQAPPLPERARSRPDIPPSEAGTAAQQPPPARGPSPSMPEDTPGSAPDIQVEEKEIVAPRRHRPKMISLTFLDGTKVSLPASKQKSGSRPDLVEAASRGAGEGEGAEPHLNDQLTARDLVSALRAVSHGADATEILGTEPRWEALFSALLSIMLRKGLIADWEFIEEFRKI